MPCHPQIKRIVQKQISQEWRHDTSLRRALITFQILPIHGLHWRFQPAFHIEQDPRLLTVLAQSRHQETMIEIIEQAPDVELYNPVGVPASASGNGDCRQRRFSRPIAIRVLVEDRIKPWLQPHLDRSLPDSVGYGRNA